MTVVYFIAVKLYFAGIFVASVFNRKASLWVKGRRDWRRKIKNQLQPGEKRILFHCASLGEFEMGKPLIEAIRENFPDRKIVLTFFSPSGYEIRKNDPLADYVFYLPADGPLNAKHFIDLIEPELVFFVKYEFWYFFMKAFRDRKIPLYFFSSIFRPTQIFFQPFGGFFYKMLKRVSHFFVQNQASLELLYNHGLSQVSVTGDTRFDRVLQNSKKAKDLPEIIQFKGQSHLFVAGSTWPADEKMLVPFFQKLEGDIKIIIAPHEISKSRIDKLLSKLGPDAARYSEWVNTMPSCRILVIDNVGMLASVYRYADAAYIGGAMGRGLHNILEAVVFGIPVFFGPHYRKFREASELVHWKGAFSVKNDQEMRRKFREVMDEPGRIEKIREINANYIDNNKGSTELIINFLKLNHPEV